MKRKILLLLSFLFISIIQNNIYAQSKVICPVCNGNKYEVIDCPNNCHNGAIFCHSCNGLREKQEICSKCNGHGYSTITKKVSCNYCNRSGYILDKIPCNNSYCNNGISTRGTGHNKCETCKGAGYLTKKIPCNNCNTQGYIIETIQEKCNCNNGYITVKCTSCNGDGSYMCQTCKGYASIKEPCHKCKGNGYIFVLDK